jgi:hypothetical protein
LFFPAIWDWLPVVHFFRIEQIDSDRVWAL